ncbi:MAG: hypothetical protein FWF76_04495 [Oscillospiraceae bacterium]|nr:hypothetical protein [Oscillospiraceae bacterium]
MKQRPYKLNITGKSASEVYTISYPDNLIRFIKYDFSPFMEKCVELCKVSMKSGRIDREEISILRSTISPCHRYFEKNIHGIFERIVYDCWIEYICRQNEISTPTLWNSFLNCTNDFERTLFSRLCEFRYNQAINQWTNLLRVQEYASKKTDFIFSKKMLQPEEVAAKVAYFDLLFNVAANEMGCGELSTNKVYSNLRTPNSPFVMSGVSREIMRNILVDFNFDVTDMEFPADYERKALSPFTADKAAMDAFSAIKTLLPEEADAVIMKSIPRVNGSVYIPESFKAVIDLEIDALIESEAVIQRCGRCLEYFLKDERYKHDYCSNRIENADGTKERTCLEIMGEKLEGIGSNALVSSVDIGLLFSRCDQLYKEMAERVNVDITQRDFSNWYKGLAVIRENVVSGDATIDDFENFAEYSRSISFISSGKNKRASTLKVDMSSLSNMANTESYTSHDSSDIGKPFEFERITREGKSISGKPQSVYTSQKRELPKIEAPKTPEQEVYTLADLYGLDISEFPDIVGAVETQIEEEESKKVAKRLAKEAAQLSELLPIDFSPPPVQRIIRGVVPSGVKELPQPKFTPPPVVDLKSSEQILTEFVLPANDETNAEFDSEVLKTEVKVPIAKYNDVTELVDTSESEIVSEEAEKIELLTKAPPTIKLSKLPKILKSSKPSKQPEFIEEPEVLPQHEISTSPELTVMADEETIEPKLVDKPLKLIVPIETPELEKVPPEILSDFKSKSSNKRKEKKSKKSHNLESSLASETNEEITPIHMFKESQTSDELDFSSILSGIKRNDSFEMPELPSKPKLKAKQKSISKEMPVSEEIKISKKAGATKSVVSAKLTDTPTSHKTKRVMDAIFGQSKANNPHVKTSEDEE